jgi:thiamine biosynthesis protein ThiI
VKVNGAERILIVRYGEVALKGVNKPWFERILEGRVRKALNGLDAAGDLKIARTGGLIVVSGFGTVDAATSDREKNASLTMTKEVVSHSPTSERIMDEAVRRVSRVFGVASVSPAVRIVSRELDDICAAAVEYVRGMLLRGDRGTRNARGTASAPVRPRDGDPGAGGPGHPAVAPLTFKIYAKRADKSYPVTSPELAAKVGEAVLDAFGGALKVDVNDPDLKLTVHLRPGDVFLYDEKVGGFGGMPLGTNGKGMVLLSGGIDSPVAAWLMAKRGMRVEAVHYHSYPYTSGRAREKVSELATLLAGYCGGFRLHVVNLLPAQEAIAQHCPEEFTTLLTRRFMMRIAERIAKETGCNMLVTGESLGQVASQTAEALFVTDAVVSLPVMRPLIALDKTDIMDLAREIGTYEKSIEPYEDCCTVFLPKHPATRPKPAEVESAESAIPDADSLINALIESKETLDIAPNLI